MVLKSVAPPPRRTWLLVGDGCAVVVASGEGGCCGGVGVPLPLFPRSPYVGRTTYYVVWLRCFAGCTPYSPLSTFSPNLALGRRHRPQSAPRGGLLLWDIRTKKSFHGRRGGMPQPD